MTIKNDNKKRKEYPLRVNYPFRNLIILSPLRAFEALLEAKTSTFSLQVIKRANRTVCPDNNHLTVVKVRFRPSVLIFPSVTCQFSPETVDFTGIKFNLLESQSIT